VIGLCVDSSAQLPPLLVERYGFEVVPHTVCIGDREFLEGVDLEVDRFYELLAHGGADVSTAQPNAGQFALSYERLAERGATEIISIHSCASLSSTVNNARMGARHLPVPVRLVEVGVAGFGVGCCAWAAAEALAAGAGVEDIVGIATQTSSTVGMAVAPHSQAMERLAADAIEMMASRVMVADAERCGSTMRVGIGTAGPAAAAFGQALEKRLADAQHISELVCFRIGPSAGLPDSAATAAYFFRS